MHCQIYFFLWLTFTLIRHSWNKIEAEHFLTPEVEKYCLTANILVTEPLSLYLYVIYSCTIKLPFSRNQRNVLSLYSTRSPFHATHRTFLYLSPEQETQLNHHVGPMISMTIYGPWGHNLTKYSILENTQLMFTLWTESKNYINSGSDDYLSCDTLLQWQTQRELVRTGHLEQEDDDRKRIRTNKKNGRIHQQKCVDQNPEVWTPETLKLN